MAVQNKFDSVTIAAGADLSSMQYKVVAVAGTIAAENDTALGIIQDKPGNGEHMRVGVKGIMKAYAGAAISLGARVKVTTSGFIITTTSGDGTACGKCLEAANSGDLFKGLFDFGPANTLYDQQ